MLQLHAVLHDVCASVEPDDADCIVRLNTYTLCKITSLSCSSPPCSCSVWVIQAVLANSVKAMSASLQCLPGQEQSCLREDTRATCSMQHAQHGHL